MHCPRENSIAILPPSIEASRLLGSNALTDFLEALGAIRNPSRIETTATHNSRVIIPDLLSQMLFNFAHSADVVLPRLRRENLLKNQQLTNWLAPRFRSRDDHLANTNWATRRPPKFIETFTT